MADNPIDPAPAAPASDSPTAPTPTPPTELGDPGKKALADERAARKAAEKASADLAAKLKALEDRDKSEADRLTERAAQAEERATKAELAALKSDVAAEKGLTPLQARRLVGTTREELETDADELLVTFAPAAPPKAPRPDPSQGAKGSTAALDLDAQIRDAQGKGDYKTVIRLQNEKFANLKT